MENTDTGTDVREVTMCTECAVIIANGDDSMPGGEEKAEKIEALGGRFYLATQSEDDNGGGCFECFGCDEVAYSAPVLFTHEVAAG